MPTHPEPLSVVLQTLWTMVDIRAARGEGLGAPQVAALCAGLNRAYHDAMALEMRAAEMEAVAADLDLIAYAKSGEIGSAEIGSGQIGPIPFTDGRPLIELTAAGFAALSLETFGESGEHVAAGPVMIEKPRLGVGPLRGEVVEAGAAFGRRRLETIQRRLQAALDAGDDDEAERILEAAELAHGFTPQALATGPTGGAA